MLGDITVAGELYIVTGYTDMRKSIDGLCAILILQGKSRPATVQVWIMFLIGQGFLR